MPEKNYLEIAHNNLRDTIKYRIKNIDGGKIYETDDFLLFTIGVDTDDGHLNGCLTFNDDAYEEIFQAAEEFFKDLGFTYSFWIRGGVDTKLANLLEEKGYEPTRTPGSAIMYTESKIGDAPIPDGFTIKKVKTLEEKEDMALVIEEAFEKEKEVVDTMFSSMNNLYSDEFKSFLIYDKEGKPVSAAITSLVDGSAGIYYISTLEEARSKGLGKAITKASTNIGFDYGKDIVILQASKLGEIVYNKLDFNKIGVYKSYKIK